MWSIGEVIASNARKYGDREALVFEDRSLGFAALDREVTRAAAALQALGVAKGDRVALMGRNTPSWVIACLGALRAGAMIVPINHKLAPPEVGYILDHCGAKAWLFEAALANVARAIATPARSLSIDGPVDGFTAFEQVMAEAGAFVEVAIAADDPAEILYTSGTTGKPKGCVHSHRTILLAGIASSLVYALGPNDRTLLAMPVWHGFPLNNLLIGSFYVGGAVVLLREYHPVEFLKVIPAQRCTIFFGAPIAYLMPLKMVPVFDDFDLSSMRAWLYGGGPIDAETARLLSHRYKSGNFFQVFGMTETGPTGMALYPHEQESKAGSIGRWAISGCDIKVMRTPEAEAGANEVGEIWMKCQSAMLGYFNDAAATRNAFQGDWYKTGDLVRVDADGYLFIVDRANDMIVAGGENVYSKEVEDVLATYPGVSEVAVIGEAHPEWGETVTAAIVASQPIDEEELRRFCRERLARYKVPRKVRILDQMPRTPTGKVMKYRLRAMFSGQ